jgi:hypothetical protein
MKWRVGSIQTVQDGVGGFSGTGFVLHDDNGRPCVTFGYLDQESALEGATLRKVLAGAKEIMRSP